MKLHFDANQQYQLDAVNSVIKLFEGQSLNKGDFEFSDSFGLKYSGVRNNLTILEEQVLENLKKVQKDNNLPISEKLNGMNFSVEMETGTGKTYVYLRTIYELNRCYGFKKFVIVVPSIAIKEGVLKSLDITYEHFQNIYNRIPAKYSVYLRENISSIRNFADSNNIEILLINIDSFAKDENVINKPNDKLNGKKPIEFIQSTNPIVIVDEPQNMETEIRKKAIESLNPVFTLRYSATHKNLYNLIYRLDPVQAYDLGLVKQIEVDSVFADNDKNRAFIQIDDIISKQKNKILVKIKIDVNTDKGVLQKLVTAKAGDDLYTLSNYREVYKDGYIINGIDREAGLVEFSNGEILYKGQTHGGLSDEIMKYQMEKAIEEHFKKEKVLLPKGIKVLTLFFIDRVKNYRYYDEQKRVNKGKFALWFEEIYMKLSGKTMCSGFKQFTIDKVHNGYFAQDKKTGFLKDSSGETNDDDDVYQLIMKDKERLLDINEPLKFIFSHSALREGWDNPNVFQICTLNETKSEMKKRQEIGRGLRLCVNQDGERIKDKNTNRLTVIANESYEDFARKLQTEMQDECGVNFEGRIKNKKNRVEVKYKKGFEMDEKFVDLWNRIKQKTSYKVRYDTQTLITNAAGKIKNMPVVEKPKIKAIRASIKMDEDGIKTDIVGESYDNGLSNISKIDIPDIITYIQNRTDLTKSTILQILKQSQRLTDILKNPQMFLDLAVSEIKSVLYDLMIDGIKYEKIAGQEYSMMLFSDKDIEAYVDNLYKVTRIEKTISENIVIDSMSEVEKKFAKDCENNDNIEFFIKLPDWFTIKTPIGNYNPDWALIYKNDRRIYFVAETKYNLNKLDLRTSELMKIKCGEAHFKEFSDVKFKSVTKLSELI
ncbi:MAG: DEAD/DEAH box helicase family protein [Elusimicrobia bacterium]|jgi:type III restriction enzyme|nr:DEAD/DEAH box helicase family protein [Elusimicrobiota bacterium]